MGLITLSRTHGQLQKRGRGAPKKAIFEVKPGYFNESEFYCWITGAKNEEVVPDRFHQHQYYCSKKLTLKK